MIVGSVLVFVLVAGCATSIRFFALKTFVSANGGFRIDVPDGVMTDQVVPGTGVLAGSMVHELTHDADGVRFTVVYGDAAPAYLASTSVDSALDAVEQDNLARTNGTQTSDVSTFVMDQPAREQRITTPTTSYRYHLVFVGDRLYSISVAGSAADIVSSESTTALGSFTLLPIDTP
jgi:hypothetical protein